MRLSRFYLVTTRETPADAELVSHRLMLRAGLIRKHGAGLYSWLPLGLKVLKRVEAIVREEMDRAGAQEVLMPSIQPAELWQESGRWEKMGPEMLRLKDRHERDFCYGPTHEEIVTHLVRQDVKSYRQLPFNLYQIQTKFRDETRPRFGVMRAREFLMKDAYSFHATHEDLVREYQNMRTAYTRVFTRLGVDFRAVQADSGNIGGSASEEFHVIADAGEDLLALSTGSDYAANLEAASAAAPAPRPEGAVAEMARVATPGQKTCEQVSRFLGVPLAQKVKLLVVDGADGGLVALALRGDHTLNEIKASRLPQVASPLALADPRRVAEAFGAETGYLGPVGAPADVPVIADRDAAALAHFTCGANENDHHLGHAAWGRDCPEPVLVADLRNVVEGDASPDGQGTLYLKRGIEGGHIFQLGRKYTAAMNATVQGDDGQPLVPEMGCYGIGVSRLVAAVIEQCHDERGIRWPVAVAPFRALVCPIGADRSAAVRDAAEGLYRSLVDAGIDTAFDDRGLRPGPMFADADLIGVPFRVVVGDKGLAAGQFEAKARGAEAPEMIPASAEAVIAWIGSQISGPGA